MKKCGNCQKSGISAEFQVKVFFEGEHYDAYSFVKKLVRKAVAECCQCESVASFNFQFPIRAA